MKDQTGQETGKRTGVRWSMLFLVMMVMCINYLDRANLSVAAPVIGKELELSPATMGILFSAFGWMYTCMLPFAGAALDKMGPRVLLTISLIGWSAFTAVIGAVSSLTALLACRVGVGFFESPVLPTNVRCVTAWFPAKERALSVGLYTSMQYISLGLLTPFLAWILVTFGWQAIFYITGGIGVFAGVIWHVYYRDPHDSTTVNQAELDYIRAGGGLAESGTEKKIPFSWRKVRQLLSHRQIWGMFIGQFAVMTILFFFLTWFPTYLINGKGLTILKGGFFAAVPFLVAIIGALLGGWWSDWMVKKGYSNSVARKTPIIVGFSLAATIVAANYTEDITWVIIFMAIAFFGQAVASTVTGALLSDMAPKGLVGLTGGMLYFIANIGGTTAPLVIGYVVQQTGGFNMALAYVSAVAACGVFAYLVVMGKVSRIEIQEEADG
ncbi:MAG TPA: MFS transporter [Telmatospirillum sp.]|nr:MFS transporter [Telmatospirillum sp.]